MRRAFIEDLRHVGHMEGFNPVLSPCSHSTHQASSLLSAGTTVSRANSCQSDSSGFLEEPPDPPAPQVGAVWGLGEDWRMYEIEMCCHSWERHPMLRTHEPQAPEGQRTSNEEPGSSASLSLFVSFDFTKQRS